MRTPHGPRLPPAKKLNTAQMGRGGRHYKKMTCARCRYVLLFRRRQKRTTVSTEVAVESRRTWSTMNDEHEDDDEILGLKVTQPVLTSMLRVSQGVRGEVVEALPRYYAHGVAQKLESRTLCDLEQWDAAGTVSVIAEVNKVGHSPLTAIIRGGPRSLECTTITTTRCAVHRAEGSLWLAVRGLCGYDGVADDEWTHQHLCSTFKWAPGSTLEISWMLRGQGVHTRTMVVKGGEMT